MTDSCIQIATIDCCSADAEQLLSQLRDKLSPRGTVVSEEGRRRTLDLFGEPLSPQQVVEKICTDVRQNGLPAVLEYTKKLDHKQLTIESVRVSPSELEQAHQAADTEFLGTVRVVADRGHAGGHRRLHGGLLFTT